ncbi:MAG: hypothetical protein AB9891_10070 [Anaerolineaceae bacterium]
MSESAIALPTYFGKWGGFFVPDPMTPALDELTSTASNLLKNGEFFKQLKEVLRAVEPGKAEIKPTKKDFIFTSASLAGWYVIAGYGVLAKRTGREVVAGAWSAAEARIILSVCRNLGLNLSIWLNVSTGSDDCLVKELEGAGVSVNLTQCRELFDDPDLYAFQKYIANPAKFLWSPIHTHSGPAPFPALTAVFSEAAAEDIMTEVFSRWSGKKVTFAAPAFPGIALAGFISASDKRASGLVSYEPKSDSQKEECYIGTYTRAACIGKKEFVFSPALVNAWESGVVNRVETTAPAETFIQKQSDEVFVVIEE